jgi:hypothetical protein
MSDCNDAARGEPIGQLGYSPEERALLGVIRHYCSSFATPEREGWIAAIASALGSFGDERGPDIAIATLGALQAIRRSRQSHFRFNAADCPACSARVSGHEKLLMSILRATRRGQAESARALALLLCEGNDPAPVVRAMQILVDRSFVPGAADHARPAMPMPGQEARQPPG